MDLHFLSVTVRHFRLKYGGDASFYAPYLVHLGVCKAEFYSGRDFGAVLSRGGPVASVEAVQGSSIWWEGTDTVLQGTALCAALLGGMSHHGTELPVMASGCDSPEGACAAACSSPCTDKGGP